MSRRRPLRTDDMIAPMFAALAAGMVIGWMLHAGPPQPSVQRGADKPPSATSAETDDAEAPRDDLVSQPVISAAPPVLPTGPSHLESGSAVEILSGRHLRLPIDDVKPESLKGGFYEQRSGDGGHTHEAVDLLAPRLTPIHAVEHGTIAKLFDSKAGGHTIYQFDPARRFVYYYAHLDHYADDLHQGDPVEAGEVIGYVGTSGNAPPSTPHLHFAIFEMTERKQWWDGRPLDPYLVFRR